MSFDIVPPGSPDKFAGKGQQDGQSRGRSSMPTTSGFAIGDRVVAKADGREMEVVSVRLAGSGKAAIYCAWGPRGSHRVIRRFLPHQIEKIAKAERHAGGTAVDDDPPGSGGEIG